MNNCDLHILKRPDKTILLKIEKNHFNRNLDYKWLLDVEIFPIEKETNDRTNATTTPRTSTHAKDIASTADAKD